MGRRANRGNRDRSEVLGMPIDKVDMVGALRRIERFLQGGSHQVITANAEIFYRATFDDELGRIIRAADMVLADGAGLVWAAEFLGDPVPERVAGIDLTTSVLELSSRAGHKVYFLGSAPGVAEKARDALRRRFPTLNVVGVHDGYFGGEEEGNLIADIRDSGAQVLLVALGAPRAEKWIHANAKKLSVPVMMGVGGSFDVYAGVAKRAPKWMQNSGLEWAYRLLRQPTRARRMTALPKFVVKVIKSRISRDEPKE